jgi:hypothetical protein
MGLRKSMATVWLTHSVGRRSSCVNYLYMPKFLSFRLDALRPAKWLLARGLLVSRDTLGQVLGMVASACEKSHPRAPIHLPATSITCCLDILLPWCSDWLLILASGSILIAIVLLIWGKDLQGTFENSYGSETGMASVLQVAAPS